MGPHFMLLLSIYVLYSNITYIYPVSCLVSKINCFKLFIPALLRTSSFLTLSIQDTPYSSSPTHLFIPNSIHSRHSNQTSQTLHLKNIHFPSVSTSHPPCLCSVQRYYDILHTIAPTLRRCIFKKLIFTFFGVSLQE